MTVSYTHLDVYKRQEYTQRIINHTDMLMAAAKNEIKRQTNETENTDS